MQSNIYLHHPYHSEIKSQTDPAYSSKNPNLAMELPLIDHREEEEELRQSESLNEAEIQEAMDTFDSMAPNNDELNIYLEMEREGGMR